MRTSWQAGKIAAIKYKKEQVIKILNLTKFNEYNPYRPHYVKQEDEAYFRTGDWKCAGSPTGAHSWYITLGDNLRIHTCKYCPKEKVEGF